MKELFVDLNGKIFFLFFMILASCNGNNTIPSKESINAIELKKGEVVLCSPSEKQFGFVEFETSCSKKGKSDFNLAVSLLHSFEYDQAEKVFGKVIEEDPSCAMAYWGVAMCNYHPLWSQPDQAELEKGAKAIAIAKKLSVNKRESDYIEAIGMFYEGWNKLDHHTRTIRFEKSMEKVYRNYPRDKEAALFYALALDAAADPMDKSFNKQRKAGEILIAMYPAQPNHPGILHYIIHSYDYPELASLALPAARKYASIAPSSAHAQHMPSHIFTRLGLWDEAINSNLASTSSARCYAEKMGMKGHWDEELHGMDYLVYAYLQKGENNLAKEQCEYLKTIHEVYPMNFKVAYAFAAIPARYLLENNAWKDASNLHINTITLPWEKFPWQIAILHFARLLGSVHVGQMDSARAELKILETIHDTLSQQKDFYKANQVQIQLEISKAWIKFKEGKNKEALKHMYLAADMEDRTEKNPVTPGEVIPARELLGNLLIEMNHPDLALEAYEADLKKHPNRFNGLFGAGLAAEKCKNPQKARHYYQQLTVFANSSGSKRPELEKARLFLKNNEISQAVRRVE